MRFENREYKYGAKSISQVIIFNIESKYDFWLQITEEKNLLSINSIGAAGIEKAGIELMSCGRFCVGSSRTGSGRLFRIISTNKSRVLGLLAKQWSLRIEAKS